MRKKQIDIKTKYLVPPELRTFIYQPNRVTNSSYVYSLIQERLFNAVMYFLQLAIKKRMNGEDYTQLSIFKENDTADISLVIPLKEIAKPRQYPYCRESIKQLAGIVVTIPYHDEKRKENRIRYAGLFRADISGEVKRSSKINIDIDRKVARLLIEIDLDPQKRPINYTKYVYEIANKAKNKYTPRIYKMICSWKKKGFYSVSLDDFRNWIGIEDKYKYYRDIKKNILLPVQKELFDKADCWFNCDTKDFAVKSRNQVVQLNFIIYSPESFREEEKIRDYVRYLLKDHFSFKEFHIEQINPVLINTEKIAIIKEKLIYLKQFIEDNPGKVRDRAEYVLAILLKDFDSNNSSQFLSSPC